MDIHSKNAYNIKVDTTQYQTNRTYFSQLYKSMQDAGIQHSDILSIWGNPYIGTVTKWDTLSYQRRRDILKDYPETDRIAGRINEAKQALTFELAVADYDTKQFIQDFVIVGLSVWAEKQFKLPTPLMAPVYATRMERAFAYIQPKYERIAYKLSDRAGKLCKKAEDFFRKKGAETAKKHTIPTAQSKVNWHVKMVQSGNGSLATENGEGTMKGKLRMIQKRFIALSQLTKRMNTKCTNTFQEKVSIGGFSERKVKVLWKS